MDFNQLNDIGFNYVTGLLSPASAPGRHQLKKLTPYADRRQLESELMRIGAAVKALKAEPDIFGPIIHELSQVKDITASALRAGENAVLDEVELFEIKAFLTLSQKIKGRLLKLSPSLELKGLDLKDMPDALKLLSKSGAGGFFIGPEYSGELAKIRGEKDKINRLYIAAQSGEHKQKYKKLHLQLAAKEDEAEYEVRRNLSQALAAFAEDIQTNTDIIARLDLIISKAALAVRYNAAMPLIGSELQIDGAYNPMIEKALNESGKTFTAISIKAGTGTTVITGANMGGKTVALKTIALNVRLALCGFFVFAKALTTPFYAFTEALLTDKQSAGQGLSSFGGEVAALDRLYKKSGQQGLILIDELAGGTNADEGARIFRAAAAAFNQKNSTVIMTTHFDGVTGEAKAHYQVLGLKNAPLKEMRDLYGKSLYDGVALVAKYMDYGLKLVKSETAVPKDAVNICRLLGLDKDILDKLN